MKIINRGLYLTAALLIIYGIMSGEATTVFTKAAKICMECIGLG